MGHVGDYIQRKVLDEIVGKTGGFEGGGQRVFVDFVDSVRVRVEPRQEPQLPDA